MQKVLVIGSEFTYPADNSKCKINDAFDFVHLENDNYEKYHETAKQNA